MKLIRLFPSIAQSLGPKFRE